MSINKSETINNTDTKGHTLFSLKDKLEQFYYVCLMPYMVNGINHSFYANDWYMFMGWTDNGQEGKFIDIMGTRYTIPINASAVTHIKDMDHNDIKI